MARGRLRMARRRPRMARGRLHMARGHPRMARGRLRMASGSQKGSSLDGPRVVSGGSSPDGPRSFTDGPRFSLQAVHGWRDFRSREAAMYHCTSRWQRGPPPRGWLSTDSPTGERTGGEPTGAHLLTNAGHRVFRWWPGCARTRPLSASRYWVGFPLICHRRR